MVSLSGSYNIILLINSEGVLTADVRPLVNLWVRVIAEEKAAVNADKPAVVARSGYEVFTTQGQGIAVCGKSGSPGLVEFRR